MIDAALRNVLLATPSVTALLAKYDATTGVPTPAIFCGDDLPDDSKRPAILISEMSSDRWGCRDRRGGVTNVDVYIFSDKTRSDADLDTLGMRVWEALNRCQPSVSGYEDWGVVADPPIRSQDGDGFPGRLVQVRARYLEV